MSKYSSVLQSLEEDLFVEDNIVIDNDDLDVVDVMENNEAILLFMFVESKSYQPNSVNNS